MMEKHEPNREEEIMTMINGILTIQDLKKFIRHVNDIDSREERKKLQNIGVIS